MNQLVVDLYLSVGEQKTVGAKVSGNEFEERQWPLDIRSVRHYKCENISASNQL